MKFVTKLSIFITVLALVSGCVSKRDIDSQTRIPSQPNREEAIKSDDKTPVKGVEGTDNEVNGETVDAQKPIIGLVINAKNFPPTRILVQPSSTTSRKNIIMTGSCMTRFLLYLKKQ